MGKFVCDFKESEDEKRLRTMLLNIFPDADLSVHTDRIEGSSSLKRFWELVDGEKIRPTIEEELKARGYLDISKMAAVAGRLALDEAFPLGKIRVFTESGE